MNQLDVRNFSGQRFKAVLCLSAPNTGNFILSLPYWGTLGFIALACADIASMIAMNVARLHIAVLPFVFAAFFIAFAMIVRSTVPAPRNAPALPRRDIMALVLMAIFFSTFCALARISYIIDPFFNKLAPVVCSDDLWHVQEISSLVNSDRYPAVSSFAPGKYLSFYYAAWMFPSALYKAASFLTIKAAFGLSLFVYTFAVVLTLCHLSIQTARSTKHIVFGLFLVGLYSGLEPFYPFQSHSWMRRFGFAVQFSNFPVLILWVMHHLLAAVALVTVLYLLRQSEVKNWWLFAVVAPLLVVFAFYSSVFVSLSALPLLLFVWVKAFRSSHFHALAFAATCTVLTFSILWLYLGRSSGFIVMHHGAHLGSRHFGLFGGFIIFVVLIAVNFAPHVWASLRMLHRSSSLEDKILAIYCLLYLISTYFIGFPGANNYAMRGAILPVMLLGWTAAKYLAELKVRPVLCVLAFMTCLASLGEVAYFDAHAMVFTYREFHSSVTERDAIQSWNKDRNMQQPPAATVQRLIDADDTKRSFYLLERIVYGVHGPLHPSDLELINNGPYGVWDWQK